MPLPADAPYPEECHGNTREEDKKGRKQSSLCSEACGMEQGQRSTCSLPVNCPMGAGYDPYNRVLGAQRDLSISWSDLCVSVGGTHNTYCLAFSIRDG